MHTASTAAPAAAAATPRASDHAAGDMNRKYGDGPVGKYSNGGGRFANFNFTRYWRQDAREAAPLITPLIMPRLDPVPLYQRHPNSLAPVPPRSDLLLPAAAPGDIFHPRGLLERFDATPALRQDLYVEIKITLDAPTAAHVGWEQVRGWCLEYFAIQRGLAAVLVLHRPGLGGSIRPNHVHVFIPARLLTADGFVGNAGSLCSDTGNLEAGEAWEAYHCA